MRQRIWAFLIVCALLISMPVNVGLAENNNEGEKSNKLASPLVFEDLKFGNLYIGMPLKELNEVLTVEINELQEFGPKSRFVSYLDGTQIYVNNGFVRSIEVTSNVYPTPRGLKVGDTTQKMRDLYGEPLYTDRWSPQDFEWSYSTGETINLTITFKGDSIQKMSVMIPGVQD